VNIHLHQMQAQPSLSAKEYESSSVAFVMLILDRIAIRFLVCFDHWNDPPDMLFCCRYWHPSSCLCLDTTASWIPLSRSAFSLAVKKWRWTLLNGEDKRLSNLPTSTPGCLSTARIILGLCTFKRRLPLRTRPVLVIAPSFWVSVQDPHSTPSLRLS